MQVFGLKNCSGCRKARAWLDERGLSYEFVDYRDHPIEPSQILAWAGQLGWDKLVNRASPTWRNLPEEARSPASDAQWLALIAAHPTLVRRPVLWDGDEVRVGFKPEEWAERLG